MIISPPRQQRFRIDPQKLWTSHGPMSALFWFPWKSVRRVINNNNNKIYTCFEATTLPTKQLLLIKGNLFWRTLSKTEHCTNGRAKTRVRGLGPGRHYSTLPKPPSVFQSFATMAPFTIAFRFNYWAPKAGSKYQVHEKRNTKENSL